MHVDDLSVSTPCFTPEGITIGTDGFEWPCANLNHDHEENADVTGRDVDRRCSDCGHGCHYDQGDSRFHHDDPTVPACRLIK